MKTPAAPAAPDPVATAQAQSQMNKATAVAQYGLQATNQNTPQGSLNYSQIGTWADGTPRFQADTTLNAGEQSVYDKDLATRQNLGDIGVSQSSRIGELLNSPFDLDAARGNKLQEIQNTFLDPQWQRQEDGLKTQLINSGVRPGSDAYTRAMRDFSDQRQQGYNRSYLDSYNTAEKSALTERNQPINEISALMSGSQVSNPSFGSTPTPGVAPTDYIGAQNMALNQQNMGWQAKVQNQQGLMNGLFGLGKTAMGGWMMSSRKSKTDIEKVGKLDNGLNVYKFRYKPEFGGGMIQLGLMADEVKKAVPDATAEVMPGIDAVNYSTVAEALNNGG